MSAAEPPENPCECPACGGRGWRGMHSLGHVEMRTCGACGGTGRRRAKTAQDDPGGVGVAEHPADPGAKRGERP